MQVVMQTATRSVYGNLRPGQVLDVDDNTGARWIKHGLAVAAGQDLQDLQDPENPQNPQNSQDPMNPENPQNQQDPEKPVKKSK